jgi:hypothetical protein
LYAILCRKTRDQCAADTFAVSCSFPARFTFGGIVDRSALAGSSQDLHQLGQVAGLVGRLKPAAGLSVAIQVDGKPAKPSMTEPPTPNRVKVFGTDPPA